MHRFDDLRYLDRGAYDELDRLAEIVGIAARSSVHHPRLASR